jgi:hypothetical protein
MGMEEGKLRRYGELKAEHISEEILKEKADAVEAMTSYP